MHVQQQTCAEGMSSDVCIIHLQWCLCSSLYSGEGGGGGGHTCKTQVLNPFHSDNALPRFHYLYLTRSLSVPPPRPFCFFIWLTDCSFCYWNYRVLSLPPVSPPRQVLRFNRDWAGCFAALGGRLQWQLSPGGAVELRGSVRQGGVRRSGPTAGENPGGPVSRASEEPARSAVHVHLRPSAAAAVPRQAEGLGSPSVSKARGR